MNSINPQWRKLQIVYDACGYASGYSLGRDGNHPCVAFVALVATITPLALRQIRGGRYCPEVFNFS